MVKPRENPPPAIVYLSSSKNGSSAAPTSNRVGQEAVTDFGRAESFLLAKTLSDHSLRSKAERTNDVKEYNRLKNSGRLEQVYTNSKVLIVKAAKDADGADVFEVRILGTGITVWIEPRFVK